MNIDVPDVEMDEVYEEGEREEFPPDEFEAEEERLGSWSSIEFAQPQTVSSKPTVKSDNN